jgi:hypothetical protein
MSTLLTRLAIVAVPALLPAQDWAQRIEQTWPGDAIRKVGEVEFEAWFAAQGSTDKARAARAFVERQAERHGLAPSAAPRFLSPGGRGLAVPGRGVDGGIPEGPEPNGDPNAIGGGTPTPAGCGDQGEGRIFPFGDRDWWQVDLGQAQDLLAWTGPGIGSAAIADTVLAVYDQAGNLLGANDDDPLRAPYSALALTLQAGRYFVAVQGFADVRTGSYALDLACAPPGSGGGGPTRVGEAAEPNASAGAATALACGQQGFGDLQPGSESDWWAFTLTRVTDVDAETGPDGPSPCRDTYLYLRDGGGTVIASDDDGGSGLYSRIQIRLQPGTYYLDMQSYQGRYAGGYTLDLRCGSGGGGGSPASFTAHPGGCAGSAGTPRLGARPGELPLLGSTFAIDLQNLPARARAFSFLGLSTTSTGGGLGLPFDLAPLGAPGCLLEVDPVEVQGLLADAQGIATAYLPIPGDRSLLGLSLHSQALVVDAGANVLGLTLSNRGTLRIGDGQ